MVAFHVGDSSNPCSAIDERDLNDVTYRDLSL
jgi:hypothetical protein